MNNNEKTLSNTIYTLPQQLKNSKFVKLKGKIPFEQNWNYYENGYNYEEIKEWNGNIGIITGYNNLLVIDVDTETGNEITKQFPETFTVNSGSNEDYKKHYYYYTAFKVNSINSYDKSKNKLIEVKSGDNEKGMNIVIPPSIHPDTKNSYEIENNTEIKQLSHIETKGLIKLIQSIDKREDKKTETKKTKTKTDNLKEEIDFTDVYKEVFPEKEIKGQNGQCPKHNDKKPSFTLNPDYGYCHSCDESWDIYDLLMFKENLNFVEAKEKLKNMYNIKEKETENKETKNNKFNNLFDKIITYDGLSKTELPEPNWIVSDILTDGLTILGGKVKTGKSFLLLNLAIDIAYGGKVFGKFQSKQSNLLYLGLEDTWRTLKKRGLDIIPELPSNMDIITEWPMGKEGREAIQEYLKLKPETSCIIVDTFPKVSDIEKNNNQYIAEYKETSYWAEIAREHNISIITSYHLRKHEENLDPLDLLNGTTGLSAGADNVWILHGKKKGSSDAFFYQKGNETEELEIALKFENKKWLYLGDADEYKGSQQENELLNSFDNDEYINTKNVCERLEINGNYSKQLIKRCYEKGLLRKEGRGQYTKTM